MSKHVLTVPPRQENTAGENRMSEQNKSEKKPVAHRRIEQGMLAAYLTVAQTATALGLSRPTIYAMIKRGQLLASRVGGQWFVSPSAVNALLTPPPDAPAEKPARSEQAGTGAPHAKEQEDKSP